MTYGVMHNFLARRFGRAKSHPCTGCGGNAAEWAYDGKDSEELYAPKVGAYSLLPEHYRPLCRRCHQLDRINIH